ncbi:conserved hypothetical protein, secreted [Candidatus Magnetomorum sp. HK-1]|nr:conserved hypothetical protein, secreted [Candidatus Magnetomorum sp. HK-1]
MKTSLITRYVLFLFILFHAMICYVIAETITGDQYENDNTYTKAHYFVVSSPQQLPQSHNFHEMADVDWVIFHGFSGRTYEIWAIEPGSRCDIVLELFDTDGCTMLLNEPVDKRGMGMSEEINTYFQKDGLYHIKIYHSDQHIYGEDTNYKIHIQASDAPFSGNITGLITDAITGKRLINVLVSSDKNKQCYSSSGINQNSFYDDLIGRYLIYSHEPGTTLLSASYQNYEVFTASIEVKEVETIEKNIQLIPELPLDLNKDNYIGLADAIYGLNRLAKDKNSDHVLDKQITLTYIMMILNGMCQ